MLNNLKISEELYSIYWAKIPIFHVKLKKFAYLFGELRLIVAILHPEIGLLGSVFSKF